MELGEKLAIIAIAVAIILGIAIPLKGYLHRRKKKKKAFFDVVWKHVFALTPEEVMSYRGRQENGYDSYYYPRRIDDKIKELIRNKKNVVVLGKPLAGKTRSVYEALKSLGEPAVVTIPRMIDINPLEFEIPANTKMLNLEILLVDDVRKFLAKSNFSHVLREFVKRRTVIVATCWLDEWDTVKQKLEQEAGLHFGEPVTQEDITSDEAKDVATQAHKAVPKTFDGNIGSIFVDLDEMKRRYSRKCSAEEKAFLRSVKRLYQAGVYEGREVFSLDKITAVGEKAEDLTGQQFHWTALVGDLIGQGFCTKEGEGLHFEEAHLQYVVDGNFEKVADFQLLADLFSDDPDALFSIGARADDKAQVSLQRAEYERLAICYYDSVLSTWTLRAMPTNYARAQNNLGIAYRSLAEVTEKASNCGNAIAAFKEALRVRTYEDFPIQYGTTQNNLGNAYRTLAEVIDKESNCGNAISAYKEALSVRTYEDFPMDYGMTQNNLGTAHIRLAEVTDRATNCGKAIAAFKEALRVRTYEDSPIQYGATQNNLGTAYRTLALVTDKALNCGNAISAYREALRVYRYEDFPIQCGMTQNNLGIAYLTLAEVTDKESNCGNAIAAFKEAQRVRTYEEFPIQYGMTQNNLGIAYRTLAEAEDKEGNCMKARAALKSAMAVFAEQKLPDWHRMASDALEALAAFCEGERESDS